MRREFINAVAIAIERHMPLVLPLRKFRKPFAGIAFLGKHIQHLMVNPAGLVVLFIGDVSVSHVHIPKSSAAVTLEEINTTLPVFKGDRPIATALGQHGEALYPRWPVDMLLDQNVIQSLCLIMRSRPDQRSRLGRQPADGCGSAVICGDTPIPEMDCQPPLVESLSQQGRTRKCGYILLAVSKDSLKGIACIGILSELEAHFTSQDEKGCGVRKVDQSLLHKLECQWVLVGPDHAVNLSDQLILAGSR